MGTTSLRLECDRGMRSRLRLGVLPGQRAEVIRKHQMETYLIYLVHLLFIYLFIYLASLPAIYPIPSYPIPSHPIPFHPIPSHPSILSSPVLSSPLLLSYPILSIFMHFQTYI